MALFNFNSTVVKPGTCGDSDRIGYGSGTVEAETHKEAVQKATDDAAKNGLRVLEMQVSPLHRR